MLERCHGWKGLLIEANPISFFWLKQSKRRAVLVHAAACNPRTRGAVDITVDEGPRARIVAPSDRRRARPQRGGKSSWETLDGERTGQVRALPLAQISRAMTDGLV